MEQVRIAAISDIHGNLLALEAVLDDIAVQDADRMVVLGDLAAVGPQPAEVLARVRSLGVLIQGNTDRLFSSISDDYQPTSENEGRLVDVLRWGKAQLTVKDIAFLDGLPFDYQEGGILFVHGSPRRINEPMLPDTPDDELSDMVADVSARLVVCGHTHRPMVRRVGSLTVVNVGSVGAPGDGDPRAGYGLLTWNGARWRATIRRVSYDVEAVIEQARRRGMPHAERLARTLRSGAFHW